VATAVIIAFASVARSPQIALQGGWAAALVIATLAMLAIAATALWKTTRFN